jgi:hypothetical protein
MPSAFDFGQGKKLISATPPYDGLVSHRAAALDPDMVLPL